MVAPLVLLVDDDADSREMYGQYLRAHDFQIVMATNGREAMALAELLPPIWLSWISACPTSMVGKPRAVSSATR